MRLHGVRRLRPLTITLIHRSCALVSCEGDRRESPSGRFWRLWMRICGSCRPRGSASGAGATLPHASNVTRRCHSPAPIRASGCPGVCRGSVGGGRQAGVVPLAGGRPYEHAGVPGFAAEAWGDKRVAVGQRAVPAAPRPSPAERPPPSGCLSRPLAVPNRRNLGRSCYGRVLKWRLRRRPGPPAGCPPEAAGGPLARERRSATLRRRPDPTFRVLGPRRRSEIRG